MTFRYKPPEPIITMRHSGKRSAAGNGMPPREALPADEAMIPYLFTLGPDGQIDALLFLSKQIPVETVSAFFGAAVRRFAE